MGLSRKNNLVSPNQIENLMNGAENTLYSFSINDDAANKTCKMLA
jgi:hypothetical protein